MPGSLLPSPNRPGLVAAWSLKFSHEKEDRTLADDNPKSVQFGSDDYDADITATLPSGFAGGTYTITVYGLSDEHYQAIATKHSDDTSKELNAVELFLYYADNSGVAGYFQNLIGLTSSDVPTDGLVADLRLKNVKRSVYKPQASSDGSGGSGSGGSGSGSGNSGGSGSSGGGRGAGSSGGSGSASAGGGGGEGARLRPSTYQFVIEVEERIYNIIAGAHRGKDKPAPPAATTHQAAIDELLHNQLGLQAGTHYKFYPAQPEQVQNITFPPEPTIGWQLAYLARRNGPLERENAPNSSGRGMLLIRDGVLHIGKRPIPLPKSTAAAALALPANRIGAAAGGGGQAAPIVLTVDAGLLETTIAGTATASGSSSSNGASGKNAHRQFTLLLRGRPDIKPGDVVKFKLPSEDAKATTLSLGALAAIADIAKGLAGIDETPDASLYVETVEHKLGRRSGFQTTLTGVEIQGDGGDTAWDPSGEGTRSNNASSGPAAAAAAVRNVTEQATGGGAQSPPNVAEVRQFTATDGGAKDPPGQTEAVWVGLSGDSVTSFDIGPNSARRGDIERDEKGRQKAEAVPYLTPFAFGKCGLVLPRYPNTRVLLAYRKGDPHDPIDIGALWQSGHIPPNASPGDWWLSLPAKVDGTPPSSIEDTETSTKDYDGKISQDLIDGAGKRAIEVTTLRIRVGADMLSDVGNKVTPASGDTAFVIEHTKNGKSATITIKDDSSIEISSDTGITFKTTGDIEMNAANVKVKVSGHMDVSS